MKNYGANKINSICWSHNNQIIAQGFDDGIIQLSAANSGKKVHQISTNVASSLSNQIQRLGAPVTSLVFSRNSEYLCAGLGDGITKIWSLSNKRLATVLTQPPSASRYGSNADSQFSPITSISLNSNNQILASSNQKGQINVYRTETFFDTSNDNQEPMTVKENFQI